MQGPRTEGLFILSTGTYILRNMEHSHPIRLSKFEARLMADVEDMRALIYDRVNRNQEVRGKAYDKVANDTMGTSRKEKGYPPPEKEIVEEEEGLSALESPASGEQLILATSKLCPKLSSSQSIIAERNPAQDFDLNAGVRKHTNILQNSFSAQNERPQAFHPRLSSEKHLASGDLAVPQHIAFSADQDGRLDALQSLLSKSTAAQIQLYHNAKITPEQCHLWPSAKSCSTCLRSKVPCLSRIISTNFRRSEHCIKCFLSRRTCDEPLVRATRQFQQYITTIEALNAVYHVM